MATVPTIELRCKVRWWVWAYLNTVAALCEMFDCDPDFEKVERIVTSGVRVEAFIGGRWKRI